MTELFHSMDSAAVAAGYLNGYLLGYLLGFGLTPGQYRSRP